MKLCHKQIDILVFPDSDNYIDKEIDKYLRNLILKYNSVIAVCVHKIIKKI